MGFHSREKFDSIDKLLEEIDYYREAEDILEGLYVYIENGPYADKWIVPSELKTRIQRHFDFDDSE